MYFDDRLATMLAYSARDDGARTAIWVQIVDLLAQDRGDRIDQLTIDALARLREWRGLVPERRRLASAVSIAGRPVSPALVRFFAEDSPSVAAPVLVRVPLSGADWISIIPSLSPTSRALLRERRDLPEEARTGLKAFGLSDFSLPSTNRLERTDLEPGANVSELLLETPIVDPVADTVPIGELVRRIEAYRKRKPEKRDSRPLPKIHYDRFAFETDADGQILWVEGVPRGPLIGLRISEPAQPNGPGVDGAVAGAFRKRDAFRNANLRMIGNAQLAGEWSLSAQPFFGMETGRFEGYRGLAKRKGAGKPEADVSLAPFGAEMRPDSVRQLVHELRTPLNAVRGFAEMIEGEFLGPVVSPYRARAQSIIRDSGSLLSVFEELDLAARTSRGDDLAAALSDSNLCAVVRTSALFNDRVSFDRAAHLQIALPDTPLTVSVDEASSARMIDRLLACVLATAQPGETLRVSLASTNGMARVEVDRPTLLKSVSDATLFDPSFEPHESAQNDLIPLGIAFVLRLIRQLAKRAQGHFDVDKEQFVLILPLQQDSPGESLETS